LPGIFLKIIFLLILAIFLSLIPVNTAYLPSEDGISIYVSSNGVHTDLILPVQSEIIDWQDLFEPAYFGNGWIYAPYIAFGWGEKGFYLNTPEWSDLKLKTALKALFIPSSSVMHVSLWPQPEENDLTKKIVLSDADYKKIAENITNSFSFGEDGFFLKVNHPGYGDYDLFFESPLKFHLFKTCNVWTNTVLKTAGIRTSFWTPFDKPILYHLSKIDGQKKSLPIK
jgi:uncharacterized protein (TIGR02117 family)